MTLALTERHLASEHLRPKGKSHNSKHLSFCKNSRDGGLGHQNILVVKGMRYHGKFGHFRRQLAGGETGQNFLSTLIFFIST